MTKNSQNESDGTRLGLGKDWADDKASMLSLWAAIHTPSSSLNLQKQAIAEALRKERNAQIKRVTEWRSVAEGLANAETALEKAKAFDAYNVALWREEGR